MATTSSDENVSITISKETIKSVKMLALVIIVGIIVVAGGLFLKERVLDPAATATTTAVTDVLRGKSYETLDEAVTTVKERYASRYPGLSIDLEQSFKEEMESDYNAITGKTLNLRSVDNTFDVQYFAMGGYDEQSTLCMLTYLIVEQKEDGRWYVTLYDVGKVTK